MGSIGPYGFSEISMVFLFHPLASFIIPLAVACVLCPALRRLFPDLAWFTRKSKGARVVQVYLVLSFVSVLAMNSGGPANLTVNLAVGLVLLLVLSRLARSALSCPDARPIVVFSRWGFVGLSVYLVLLYGVTYIFLKPRDCPRPRCSCSPSSSTHWSSPAYGCTADENRYPASWSRWRRGNRGL